MPQMRHAQFLRHQHAAALDRSAARVGGVWPPCYDRVMDPSRTFGKVPQERLALLCSGIGLIVVLAMTCAHGKVMSIACRNTPAIETCVWEAQNDITDPCLRDCVIEGCRGVKIDCTSDEARARCNAQRPGGVVGGYAKPKGHNCKAPADEVAWCELAVNERCRAVMMVHELGHRCGWEHGMGFGVPGDNGSYRCHDE